MNRFMSYVSPEPMSGCWLWTGCNVHDGYGVLVLSQKMVNKYFPYKKSRTVRANRISYMMFNGEIPKKILVLHKCDTPACVNPKHLFLGTIQDNNLDRKNKGRGFNQKKTHCPYGHKYDHIAPDKRRKCKTCWTNQRIKRKINKNLKKI